eukprot:1298908-Amorphochlora_amoeboformis.AAC.1
MSSERSEGDSDWRWSMKCSVPKLAVGGRAAGHLEPNDRCDERRQVKETCKDDDETQELECDEVWSGASSPVEIVDEGATVGHPLIDCDAEDCTYKRRIGDEEDRLIAIERNADDSDSRRSHHDLEAFNAKLTVGEGEEVPAVFIDDSAGVAIVFNEKVDVDGIWRREQVIRWSSTTRMMLKRRGLRRGRVSRSSSTTRMTLKRASLRADKLGTPAGVEVGRRLDRAARSGPGRRRTTAWKMLVNVHDVDSHAADDGEEAKCGCEIILNTVKDAKRGCDVMLITVKMQRGCDATLSVQDALGFDVMF